MPVCSRHGRSCPFQESPFPGGCGSESHQTIGGLKRMLPLGSTHTPHTGCCSVHRDLELQSVSHMHLKTMVCSEVSTCSDKCLLCWLTSSRPLFYLWALGYTGGILDFYWTCFLLFNGWPQFSLVQLYLRSICKKESSLCFPGASNLTQSFILIVSIYSHRFPKYPSWTVMGSRSTQRASIQSQKKHVNKKNISDIPSLGK